MISNKKPCFRSIPAVLICLIMMVTALALPGMAEEYLNVGVQWTDGEGNPQYAQAMPIAYAGYEGSYWVQVPSDAFPSLCLSIQDPAGAYVSFNPADGMSLSGQIFDAGYDLSGAMPLEIMGYTADGQPGALVHLYVSTMTATPEQPQAVIPDADVTVRYLNRDGLDIATATRKTLPGGTHEIYPEAYDLQPNYTLASAGSQTVTVNEYGANPGEVIFYYDYVKPYVAPVNVTVHYADAETYAPVASDTVQTVEEGTHEVYPAAFDLQPNYELTGANAYSVTVSESGADQSEVTFYYTYVKPYVAPVNVTVHYVDAESLLSIASDTVQTVEEGTWDVYPSPVDLMENYELTGDGSIPVTVDENGASAYEVTFRYAYHAPAPATAVITVYVMDQADETVVSSFEQEVMLNEENSIYLNEVPDGYTLSGADMMQVFVDEEGNPDPMPIFYLTKDEPISVDPVQVMVRYLDKDTGESVALDQWVECPPAQTTVINAQPVSLQEGYALVSGEEISVWVDENGFTESTEVVFYYEKESADPTDAPTAAPVVVEPALVTIRFLNQDQEPVAPDQELWCQEGDTPIVAPDALEQDYVLDGENTVIIHVDENGADQDLVIFYYRSNSPVPKIALVAVKYVDVQQGNVFYNYTETCQENLENIISVDWNVANQYGFGAYLVENDTVYVTVDAFGMASPAEVSFNFVKPDAPTETPTEVPPTDAPTEVPPTETPTQPPVAEAYVQVLFLNSENLPVASSQEVQCFVGSNLVEARPADLLADYVLEGENVQQVILDADGSLNPAQVIFYYTYLPTQPPVVTEAPFSYDYEPMDAYCYPNGDTINFRSGPSTGSNKLATLNKTQLGHIFGTVQDENKETWYCVEIDGVKGFLKGSVTRILTDAEVNQLFGYTPVPSPVPTVSPTPIPDNEGIDRWGETNSKVNFRTDMSSGASRVKGLEQLSSKTKVWVLTADTVENQRWYSVQVNGKEGYLMAEFVNLFTQEESDIIQAQLPSPVPTQVPESTPTAVPTEEPPLPTQTPAPTPEATPTPVPYKGYAVTQWQVALRPGVADEAVLEWLANDSLVYISGQTYVDGEAYSSVQAMASGNYGFVVDKALMPITNEEAKPYLDKLLPPEITPTPVPEQQQGFAMTQGDGVPLRAFADTNGAITQLLPYGAVASVINQTFTGGQTWHLVQYKGTWGYVRADQMRMLSEDETIAYLQSQEQIFITPEPAPTPEPITPESLSSYGHVLSNSGKVNLRSQPSKSSDRLRMLDNYAFALVLGQVENNDGTWYHVSQAGTEGYISGDFFKVLSLSELTSFLQSSEYQNANSESSQTGSSSSQIQPVEDYNQTVWKNPALSASYEPFNPYTATPNPEMLPIATPTPPMTPAPTVTPEIAPVGGLTTPEPVTKSSGSSWVWVLLGLAAVGGGGAYYAYTVYQKNERRRQAVRVQQMQRARQNQAAAQPQMRAAQNNPAQQATRMYNPQSAAPFMPPQGTPRASTGPNQAASAARVPQTTNPYRPLGQQQNANRTPGQTASNMGSTQMYRPVNPTAYQNTANPAQDASATQAYRPANASQAQQSFRGTQVYRPADPAEKASASSGDHQRQRRSDRHKNENGEA